MAINERDIKTWSQIGSRATFGLACLEIGKKEKNLIVLTSDVSTSAGLDRFKRQLPNQYIDVGISEQNLIGVASGLSSEGFKIITTTFSPFQTLRCCEQIKVNLGYMKNKICFTGIASGVVLGTLGYTHCSIEDMAIIRSIPNISVVSPADCLETVKAVNAAIDHHESVYLRLTGGSNNPIVYEKDYKFEIGKSIKIIDGTNISIFACGSMVHKSLLASKILKKSNIDPELINFHTIKPIDKKRIEEAASKSKLIFTIEEHSINGGLGSAVSEVLAELKTDSKLIRLGLGDNYNISGEYKYILEKNQLSEELIAKRIKDEFSRL